MTDNKPTTTDEKPATLDDIKNLLEEIIEQNVEIYETLESIADEEFEQEPAKSGGVQIARAIFNIDTALILSTIGLWLWIIFGNQ